SIYLRLGSARRANVRRCKTRRGRTPGAGAVVKQNEASHAPAPRETSTPGGRGSGRPVFPSLKCAGQKCTLAAVSRACYKKEPRRQRSNKLWKVGLNLVSKRRPLVAGARGFTRLQRI